MSTEQLDQIGPYEIRNRVSEIGETPVYHAVHERTGRHVLLKVLPEDVEPDAIGIELRHPNVTRVLESDRDEKHRYLALEMIKGESLSLLMQERALSLTEALSVFKSIARGLEAAHARNLVHGDLNPTTTIVSPDLRTVKIGDFGAPPSSFGFEIPMGSLPSMESLAYLSPEQIHGDEPDRRSDIYAAGLMLYTMLTRRPRGPGGFRLPSQLNPEVPSSLDPIILRCLASRPEDRYSRISEALDDLRQLENRYRIGLVHELQGISRSADTILRRSPQRMLWAWILLAIASVGSAAGIFVLRHRENVEQAAALEAAAAEAREASESVGGIDAPEVEPDEQEPPQDWDAAFAVARNKFDAGLNDQAFTDLERLVANAPDHAAVPDALLMIGLIHESLGRTDDSMATYVEVRTRFEDRPQAAEARYRVAELMQKIDEPDRKGDARNEFAAVSIGYPHSPWAPKALMMKARLEQELGMSEEDPVLRQSVPSALLTFRRLIHFYPEDDAVEDALWNLAELYREIERFDLAAETFTDLGRTYPDSGHDAWWEAARLYDRILRDDERAREAYANVPERSPQYSKAVERAEKLNP